MKMVADFFWGYAGVTFPENSLPTDRDGATFSTLAGQRFMIPGQSYLASVDSQPACR